MTDHPGSSEWLPVLREFAQGSGHELRNALNGLVVNLEVVRVRSSKPGEAEDQFLSQAIEQAEESVRLAEGTIALLNLLAASIDGAGRIQAKSVPPNGIEIESSESEATRVAKSLKTTARRTSFEVSVSGGAVILSMPERTPESN